MTSGFPTAISRKAILKQMFVDLIDYIETNLSDAVVAEAVRGDLDLAAGLDFEKLKEGEPFRVFADGIDPDTQGLKATAGQIVAVAKWLADSIETMQDNDDPVGLVRDLLYFYARLGATDTVRVRYPALYATIKALLLLSDTLESYETFDPARFMAFLRGEGAGPSGESDALQSENQKWIDRGSTALALVPVAAALVLPKIEALSFFEFDYFSGWEAFDGSPTPLADRISARTTTMLLGLDLMALARREPGASPAEPERFFGADGEPLGSLFDHTAVTRTAISMALVERAHGGPGLMLGLGAADIQVVGQYDNLEVAVQAGVSLPVVRFIPFSPEATLARTPAPTGDIKEFLRFGMLWNGEGGELLARLRDGEGSGLEVAKAGFTLEYLGSPDPEAVRLAAVLDVAQATLVIAKPQDSRFLAHVVNHEVRVDFGFRLVWDHRDGVRLEGGSGLKVSVPVHRTSAGLLEVHTVNLGVELGQDEPATIRIELSAGLTARLGPVRLALDRIGVEAELVAGEGNFGFAGLDLVPRPPTGIGVAIDGKVVRAGGFIYLDRETGEYAGVLEGKLGPLGIKLLGIVARHDDAGENAWSFLLLAFGEFPPLASFFGFSLTGLGFVLGIRHGVDFDALVAGLRGGVIDDILFPANPVADAPRIIGRLKTVYPYEPHKTTAGIMAEFSYGLPEPTATLRLGLILTLRNDGAASNRDIAFDAFTLIGQFRNRLPAGATPDTAVVQAIFDFAGSVTTDPGQFLFVGRLRDSFFGPRPVRCVLEGMAVGLIRAATTSEEGEEPPVFIIALGGFHPAFAVPEAFPVPVERLSSSYAIGKFRIRDERYLAIAGGGVQLGGAWTLKADFGNFTLDARLAYDVMLQRKPALFFAASVSGSGLVRYKGYDFAGMSFSVELTGPYVLTLRGEVRLFCPLFDVCLAIEESWPEIAVVVQAVDARALMAAELANPANWSVRMPTGSTAVAIVGSVAGEARLLLDPLGALAFSQQVLPFDLALDQIGESRIEGPNRFSVTGSFLGGVATAGPGTPVTEYFALGDFKRQSEAERLSQPGFQKLPSGCRLAGQDYACGQPAPDQPLEHETLYLDPVPRAERPFPAIDRRARIANTLPMRVALGHARRGAVARARFGARLGPTTAIPIRVHAAPLAAARRGDLAAAAALLSPTARRATALARNALGPADRLVEAWELDGDR